MVTLECCFSVSEERERRCTIDPYLKLWAEYDSPSRLRSLADLSVLKETLLFSVRKYEYWKELDSVQYVVVNSTNNLRQFWNRYFKLCLKVKGVPLCCDTPWLLLGADRRGLYLNDNALGFFNISREQKIPVASMP